MFSRILKWIIVIVIVVALAFIYFVGSQLRYESEGARFFKESRYDIAAEKYLKAYESTTVWGRDRYLYLVAQCYHNAGDWQRAMDFYIRLTKEFPGSNWVVVAQPAIDRTLDKIEPDRLPPQLVTGQTELARALSNLKGSYRRLVTAIRENKSGTSIEVEGEYQKYKKYQAAYRQEIVKAYAAVKAGKSPDDLGGQVLVPDLEQHK